MIALFFALVLALPGQAQVLKWLPPTQNTNGTPLDPTTVKGYRVGYEILEEGAPCAFSPNRPIRYWIDVGMGFEKLSNGQNKLDLNQDPTFKPGLTYAFSILVYTNKVEDSSGWGTSQSTNSNAACKKVDGPPRIESLAAGY